MTSPHAHTAAGTPKEHARLQAFVKGHVQGVGFRWWTRARALELGLSGWACNLEDGRVDFVAERWGEVRGETGFGER
jgi:hypothetical protein